MCLLYQWTGSDPLPQWWGAGSASPWSTSQIFESDDDAPKTKVCFVHSFISVIYTLPAFLYAALCSGDDRLSQIA